MTWANTSTGAIWFPVDPTSFDSLAMLNQPCQKQCGRCGLLTACCTIARFRRRMKIDTKCMVSWCRCKQIAMPKSRAFKTRNLWISSTTQWGSRTSRISGFKARPCRSYSGASATLWLGSGGREVTYWRNEPWPGNSSLGAELYYVRYGRSIGAYSSVHVHFCEGSGTREALTRTRRC